MTLDNIIVGLLLAAIAFFLLSASLLLHVRMKLRQWRPLRVVERDGDGRKRQERI